MCSQSVVHGPPVSCERYAGGPCTRHVRRTDKKKIHFISNFIVKRVSKIASYSVRSRGIPLLWNLISGMFTDIVETAPILAKIEQQ